MDHHNGQTLQVSGDCTDSGHNKIHGNWGSWAGWAGCSKSCGSGKQVRKRECNDPVPQYGGDDCFGSLCWRFWRWQPCGCICLSPSCSPLM